MKTLSIYLAKPIDRAGEVEFEESIQNLSQALSAVGINSIIYSPGQAFYITPGSEVDQSASRSILGVNMTAIAQCDIVVMMYYQGVETWGCAQELLMADSNNTPVYLLVMHPETLQYSELPTYIKAYVKDEHMTMSWNGIARIISEDMAGPDVNDIITQLYKFTGENNG